MVSYALVSIWNICINHYKKCVTLNFFRFRFPKWYYEYEQGDHHFCLRGKAKKEKHEEQKNRTRIKITLLVIALVFVSTFTIDYNRAKRHKRPLFALKIETSPHEGSTTYYSLFYKYEYASAACVSIVGWWQSFDTDRPLKKLCS